MCAIRFVRFEDTCLSVLRKSVLERNKTSAMNSTVSPTVSANLDRYLILQIFMIPGVLCYLLNFYHFLYNAAVRRALNNHIIILLLTINFLLLVVDVPFVLEGRRTGIMKPQSDVTCHLWLFIDYYLFLSSLLSMTFASLERHLFVFHHHLFTTAKKRLLVHYCPVLFCVFYPLIYYIGVLYLYPCKNYYNFARNLCSSACFLDENPNLALYEFFAHGTIPTVLIALLSLALLIRVLRQKRRMGQREHWNRHRKIILQMISISSLFLVTNLPLCVVVLIQLFGLPYFASNIMSYLFLLVYINPTILPFISILSLPGLKQTFKCFSPRRNTRRNQIEPQANIITQPRGQLRKSGQ